MHTDVDTLLIGAHTSIQGGVDNALFAGQEIGATTVQIFTSNQKRWEGRKFSADELTAWKKALETTGLRQIMSHASYLVNLASPKQDVFIKSKHAFREEIVRCQELDLAFLNFHPGAAVGDTSENALQRLIEALLGMEDLLAGGTLKLLLETTAGQGTTLGANFEELAFIINAVKGHIPIGVCIDTCHIFVAGYDIRTKESWENTLRSFDDIIGLEYLYAFHLNDSVKPYGSRSDRHADLGKGEIGIETFRYIMQDPRTRELPKYLETPGYMSVWKKEIELLRKFGGEL